MKVISGFLKGRVVNGYNIDGTRPTMDRVKESIFAMIQSNVFDSIVLDLFAGSGNYGIEAISNYSKLVYFNDCNKECIKVIKNSLKKFNIENKAVVYNYDYKKCLNILKQNNIKFDIIFLDPPYKFNVISDILKIILENDLLKKNGIIVCEYTDDILLDNYSNLKKIKEKKYGEKKVSIYRKE